MKSTYTKLAALLTAFAVLALLTFAGGTYDGLGPSFRDSTRTNTWDWADPGLAPVMKVYGTTYTAITTNLPVIRGGTGGVGTTNTLHIVNGLLVNID